MKRVLLVVSGLLIFVGVVALVFAVRASSAAWLLNYAIISAACFSVAFMLMANL